MADDSPAELFERASSTITDGGWSRLLQSGFGTIFLAWVWAATDLIGNIFSTLFSPVRALMGGFATFIEDTIGSGMRVIDAGADTSVLSFQEGIGQYAGPAGFFVGVVVVVGALLALEWWWNKSDFSPWGIFRGD